MGHLEYSRFLKLVSEECNMNLEDTEKQILQLVDEIKQNITDGEVYKIEGFGVFSSFDSNLAFTPSNELETEINFKYVGMEPIELDTPVPISDDPSNVDEDNSTSKSLDSIFNDLVVEDDIDQLLMINENSGSEMSVKQEDDEEEYVDRLFAELKGEEYSVPLSEDNGIDFREDKIDIDLSDVFDDSLVEFNTEDNLGEEIASIMEDNIFEQEDIDTTEDDANAESSIEHLEPSLKGGESYEDLPDINVQDDDIYEYNHSEEDIIDIEVPKKEKEDILDLDNAIVSVQDEPDYENQDQLEDIIEDNVLPVIGDTHSVDAIIDQGETKENIEHKNKKKEVVNTSKRKRKELKKQQVSAWFWLFTILILSSGLILGLTFFKVIDVPFLGFEKNNSDALMVNQTPKVPPINENKVSKNIIMSSNNGEIEAEQGIETVVQENESNASTFSASSRYGLMGELTELANDGYTIILFTLRNQNNANNEVQKLINAGYRAFLTPITNERIGIMHRVSLGQFRSLVDAEIAAEEVENLLPENYIIQKIN